MRLEFRARRLNRSGKTHKFANKSKFSFGFREENFVVFGDSFKARSRLAEKWIGCEPPRKANTEPYYLQKPKGDSKKTYN